MTVPAIRWQAARFAIVGLAATAVHAMAALASRQILETTALMANAIGYVSAVGVSYGGSLLWTFRVEARLAQAARFVGVSLAGLGLNEALTYVIVETLGLPFTVALGVVIIVVPTTTYLLSRCWVFGKDIAPRSGRMAG